MFEGEITPENEGNVASHGNFPLMSAPDVLHQNARSSVVLSYHIVAMTQKKRAQLLQVKMVFIHMTRLSGYRKFPLLGHTQQKN